MLIGRLPRPALRPFVKVLWANAGVGMGEEVRRERVLPTGTMHIAFRLSDHPLRVYDDLNAKVARTVGHVVVGGARSTSYVREVTATIRSVGAQLQPGAASLLLGVPCDELADRHTRLDDLWGRAGREMRERLVEEADPGRQLDLLESMLAARLPRVRCLHPAVSNALARFATSSDVGGVVTESGFSHRHFIALFSQAVGLTPKRYCRVRRFQDALRLIAAQPAAPWIDLALGAGYSDQPHFNREFRAHGGVSPGEYRGLSPSLTHHLPIR